MIDPKHKELVTNPVLWDELIELAKRHDVEILGKVDEHYHILVRGYRPPNPAYVIAPVYDNEAPAGTTNLLMRVHQNHPHAKPDMFWVRPFVLLPSGAYPNAAETIQQFQGKDWQRFSWHLTSHNWRPFQDTLANTWMPFIDQRLSKVV